VEIDTNWDHAAVVKTLVPLAHRWEDLRFHHIEDTDNWKQVFEKFKSLDLPRLERLAIWSENWEAAEDIYSTWTMPKLRRVIFNNGVPKELPGKSNILECDLVIESYGFRINIPKVSKFLDSFISLTTLRLEFKCALADSGGFEMRSTYLPNLRAFHADLYFYTGGRWHDKHSPSNVAIYCFIVQLVAPRMEQLRVAVRHDASWDGSNEGFLCSLFRAYGKSSTLRTLEFIQEDGGLGAIWPDSTFNSIFGCPCKSNVVLSGLLFDSSDRSIFKLEIPNHGEGVLGLRTLTFRNCRLSIRALEALLRLYKIEFYTNFEGITLTQCAGISRESLRGVVGSEYVVLSDD
jgi:hypothetical protein